MYDYTFAKGTGIASISKTSWSGENGAQTTCVASLADGYVFDGWYDANNSKVSSSATFTVTAGSTAEGKYTAKTAPMYQYTFAKGTGIASISKASWTGAQGATTTCTATLTNNYVFDGWYNANGTKVSSSTTLTVTAGSMAEGEYTAMAGYNLATITVNISGAGGSVSGGGTYTKGTQVTIAATTPSNRRFLRWNDGSTSPSRRITVTANATYTAVYSSTYVKAVTSGASGTAYVGGSGTYTQCYYDNGDSVTVRAYPGNNSISFMGWYNGNTLVSSKATYTFSFGGTSITLTARFQERKRDYTLLDANATYGTARIIPGGKSSPTDTTKTSYTASFGQLLGFSATITDKRSGNTWVRGVLRGWYSVANNGALTLITKDAYWETRVPEVYGGVTYKAMFEQASTVTVITNVTNGERDSQQRPVIVTNRGTVKVEYDAVVNAANHTYYEGLMTFRILPPTGYHVAGWMIDGVQQEGAASSAYRLDVDSSCTITAIVLKNTCNINCIVNEASQGCGTCELQVKGEGDTWITAPTTSIDYGTQCRVLVQLLQTGGAFRRLRVGDSSVAVEELSPTSWAYTFKSTFARTSVDVAAYFGNTFQVAAKHVSGGSYEDETYGRASVARSESSTDEVQSVEFTYGEVLYLRADNSDDEEHPAYFVGWHSVVQDTPSESRILNMRAIAQITPTPTSPLTYWAEFKNAREMNAIWLSNGGAAYGRLSLVSLDGNEVTEIPKSSDDPSEVTYDSIINDRYPALMLLSSGATSGTNDTLDRFYAVPLGTRVLISCEMNDALSVLFDEWQMKTHTGRNTYDSDGVTYGNGPVVEHIVAGDEVFMAKYDSDIPAKVTLGYREESLYTDGTIRLSPAGDNADKQDTYVAGDFTPGEEVTAIATPRSGYVFSGWYASAVPLLGETPISTKASYTFTKDAAPQELYAKFEQDDNAIFVWEGDEASKMMVWRSRRTRLAQPMNFSSAAACADGYPLQLKVAYASAPDPAEDGWREGVITINNQDPRRLPMLRPERYVEVEVRSDKPVLRVAVASSMMGLLG